MAARIKTSGQKPPRLSVTLSPMEHDELQFIATKHDISMAWLGRQAILEFLAKHRDESYQLPLKLTPRSKV